MNKPVNITEEVINGKILIQDLINKFILIKYQKSFKEYYIFYVCSKTNILTLRQPSYRNKSYKFNSLEYYACMDFLIFIL